MNKLIVILIVILIAQIGNASVVDKIRAMAKANGFKVSNEVAIAIADAALAYRIDPMHLTAIGIIETGLGRYTSTRRNSNGTEDHGLFQINTVNLSKCKAFNINTVEGSAMCAAKLLSQIKMIEANDIGKYHSKTPSKKLMYYNKIKKVMKVANNNH